MNATMRARRVHIPKHCVGMLNSLEFTMEFLEWVGSLPDEPTPESIQARFGVCRATAFRWRSAYRAFQKRRSARGGRT